VHIRTPTFEYRAFVKQALGVGGLGSMRDRLDRPGLARLQQSAESVPQQDEGRNRPGRSERKARSEDHGPPRRARHVDGRRVRRVAKPVGATSAGDEGIDSYEGLHRVR